MRNRFLLVVLMVFALPAFAQVLGDPAPATPSGSLFTALYVGVAGVLLALGTVATLWLAGKGTSSKAVAFASRLWEVALNTVAFVESRSRPTITGALADGKLSVEEMKQIQSTALAAFKESLGSNGLADLKKLMGITDTGLDGWIGGLLERAFQFFKANKAATPLTPNDVQKLTQAGAQVTIARAAGPAAAPRP